MTVSTESIATLSLVERAHAAAEVAASHADDVDSRARFPREAVEALRDLGLLGAAAPRDLGGEDATVPELAEVAEVLGAACSATAMIFAMHQIQVLCLTRHDDGSAIVRSTLEHVGTDGWLLASVTTEAGIGGNTRTSSCAVDEGPDGVITLSKTAPVISYGAFADAFLVTARRGPDSAPSDQVLVVCERADVQLSPLSEWDTLGFRGTCSPGFQFDARVPRSSVLAEEYATISAATMLPVSHLLWASVWLGIATAAADRATTSVQRAARKSVGTLPPAATRLADLLGSLSAFSGTVRDATKTFAEIADDRAALSSIPRALAFNSLKITASEAVIDIVSTALLVTGIGGYRNDSELSLGRLLRDSYGTAVMVNNDRILANNAQLALMQRRKGRR